MNPFSPILGLSFIVHVGIIIASRSYKACAGFYQKISGVKK